MRALTHPALASDQGALTVGDEHSQSPWAFYHPVMVSTPVLATKLFAPARRPQLVARPRIAQRLDSTLEAGHRLTLVSAPAGFGKTTCSVTGSPTSISGRDTRGSGGSPSMTATTT